MLRSWLSDHGLLRPCGVAELAHGELHRIGPLAQPRGHPWARTARSASNARHSGSDAEKPAARILCPYGILYGGRGWLVAHVDALPEMRLWRLDRIVSIDLLDRGFARREEFDLAAYAALSFGVFQEEPIDVVLRFEPEAADDAAGWLFHPSQSIERELGGALTVRFRAGGVQEMCWHLFTWGTTVTIVAPGELRAELAGLAAAAAAHHGGRRDKV